jgi:serine/threonine-protein kinase
VGNAVVHSGTVKVLDDDITEDGAPFLVMELLEGESLGARLDREGTVPAYEVALLADQLLDVLAAAHAAHIVHRDLKPDNVFLTVEGRIKVLDFGIARLRSLAQESSASTQAGSLLGTPAFMAPEQALGRWKDVDERTDIWAVGATLFTLLSGRFVHEAEAVQEQLVLAATSKAEPLQKYVPQAPDWLCAVVDRALAFGRDLRFPDARSMQAALRQSAQGIDFPAYPMSAPGVSGQRSSLAQTPAATPRALSSPSFGEGATLVASEPTSSLASVQAVARSAQEPAPSRRTSNWVIGLLAMLGMCVVGAVTFAVLSRPHSLGQGGVTLPSAAAPPASGTAVVAASPSVTLPKETVTRPPALPPSATAPVAANVTRPAGTAGKKPLLLPKFPPLGPKLPPPPEHRENLFDNRH